MKKTINKVTAYLLVFTLLLNLFPVGFNRVNAFDPAAYKVTDIIMGKTYDRNRNLSKMYITVLGEYLADAEIGIINYAGGFVDLAPYRKVNLNGVQQFELDEGIMGQHLRIGTKTIPIDEGSMPTMTGITRRVALGDTLVITGSNLRSVMEQAYVEARYGRGGAYSSFDPSLFDNNKIVSIPNMTGEVGLQDVVFTRETVTAPIKFNELNENTVQIRINYTYIDQFRLIEELHIPDLEMFPNRGEKGETVYFRAPNLDEYDVFFLQQIDGTDPYTNSNRGLNTTYAPNADGFLDILTVQAPDIELGEYYVVITNKISPGKDPMREVVKELVVRIDNNDPASDPEKFTIIDGKKKARVLNIQPNEGSDSGAPAEVSGLFVGSLNVDGFKFAGSSSPVFGGIGDEILSIEYGEAGGDVIGHYMGSVEIAYIKKTVKIIIGNRATFTEEPILDDLDKFQILTPQVTDADTNPVKDVVAEIETVLYQKGSDKKYIFKERAVLEKGYTYVVSRVQPVVNTVVPQKIQVREVGGKYLVTDERMAVIYGKDFFINRFEKDGKTVVRYPIVRLGNVRLDKNNPETANLKLFVLDANGNILDGSRGNDLGVKIIVYIPAGTEVSNLGKAPAGVINPVRNSEAEGLSHSVPDLIEFVKVEESKVPVIESVTPHIVAEAGGETITVLGSNFQGGVRVFLDGKEIVGVTRSGDGRVLTFTAPPGREGETQLQVMNPEGGIATWPFIYVKTYTEPNLADFAPKSGTAGTLVVIRGHNFLKADPTSQLDPEMPSIWETYKLLGTRVFLGGVDVNDYNIHPDHKGVIFNPYNAPVDDLLLRIENEKLVVAPYYHSVVLVDNIPGESVPNYYTLDVDAQGRAILFDGRLNRYIIKLNESKTGLVADKEGAGVFELEVDEGRLLIKEIASGLVHAELSLKTAYKVDENNRIVGNRVKVVDSTTIYFVVPAMPADGYYDLSIVNPDTQKSSKTGANGFFYYSRPLSNPKILAIEPAQGSTAGGYDIEIFGEDFEDSGGKKTRVFINGQEIGAADTIVSINGKKITVRVPAYPGDLVKDKGTDRLTVPVVVVNPDGASDSKADGFTYIVPFSHPIINYITPAEGSAAGGEIVEILGSDFRLGEGGEFPYVYFGRERAIVTEYSRNYLKVITPPGQEGLTEVYVLNFDSGISNKVSFRYTSSNPKITMINPDVGRRQGKDRVDILGSGFVQGLVNIYGLDKDGDLQITGEYIVPVRFGGITNRDIPRAQPNSGRIDSGRTTVNLAGGLQVIYDGIEGKVHVSITELGKTYAGSFDYEDIVVYIPADLLTDASGAGYEGYELIRLEVNDKRLIVDRGYAPEVVFISSAQLRVRTPSYYTVGTVEVMLFNPDGGEARSAFTYLNPDSKPYITNITKDGRLPEEQKIGGQDVKALYLDYRGGNIVSILGFDFRENAKIQISDIMTIQPKDITYALPGRLTFRMPAVAEKELDKLHRVIVINEDGGAAYSDEVQPKPIYLVFVKGESAPAIEQLEPARGPAKGGAEVIIRGRDFRENPQVFFGEVQVPSQNVLRIDYRTIMVVTPPGEPGPVEVRVENMDGSISIPSAFFTYISSPTITAVVDPRDPGETRVIETISVEGGQEIKLKGAGFMVGARVIFDPKVRPLESGETEAHKNVIYVDGIARMLIGGTDGLNITVVNSETILVKTPKGRLGSSGLMIVNTDGGASGIYGSLTYNLPELDAPGNVVAELVFNRYIRIHWQGVEGASEYEVFMEEDGKPAGFAGATQLTSYFFGNLKPRTTYRFVIKAVGNFGSSRPSAESNMVRTGSSVGPPDIDGALNENTQMSKNGDRASVYIGADDFHGDTITVDLMRGTLAGSKEVVVSIPASVAASSVAGDIVILGRDFMIRFNPGVFNNSFLSSNSGRADAGVQLKVSPLAGNPDAAGFNSLSAPYVLEASAFVGKQSMEIDYLRSFIQVTLDYDQNKADMRRLNQMSLYRYDEQKGSWEPTTYSIHETGSSSVMALVDRLGKYLIIGSRR
ncbi:MAG: IPT/TIG domain-containing protein [Bacillota bacterium]